MHSLTPSALHRTALAWLADGVPAVVVSVADAQGSTPRDAGTRMLVSADAVHGTIGGGHLEWQAIDLARHALGESPDIAATQPWHKRIPLGPALGQCCGGVVCLRFSPLNRADVAHWAAGKPRMHVELHGAGHVGQAIIKLLADIDCTVRWIDMRENHDQPGMPTDEDIASLPTHITWHPTDDPAAEVSDAPADACHLVLTHRHDLDLRIIEAVLRRGDARYAGLIGSRTKRARFLHRLGEKGISEAQLARLVCPIGIPGIEGKEPAVIAVAVVAQLLLPSALDER